MSDLRNRRLEVRALPGALDFREIRHPGVPRYNGVFCLVRRPLEDSPVLA